MSERGDLMTIDEMVARAELEPSLRDFYVEGTRDVAILREYFEHMGMDVSVFAISDRVEVRREDVEPYSQDYGQRAKLVAVAALVELASERAAERLTFVIDSDWAAVVGPIPIYRSCLLMTDLPSMDHYAFESEAFSHFLRAGLGKMQVDPSELRARLKPALRDLAAARMSLKDLNVACVEKVGALIVAGDREASADSAELVKRSLDRLGADRPAKWASHVSEVRTYRGWLDEVEHNGRGHDIALVLVSVLGLKGHFADVEVVESLMRASTHPSHVEKFPLFRSLTKRAA